MQQPTTKLGAMMQGLMGGNDSTAMQQQQAPGPAGSAPPSADQPTGMPRVNDPAYPAAQKVKEAVKALSKMYQDLGDMKASLQVEKMSIEIGELAEARIRDFMKKQELEQKIGGQQGPGPQPEAGV